MTTNQTAGGGPLSGWVPGGGETVIGLVDPPGSALCFSCYEPAVFYLLTPAGAQLTVCAGELADVAAGMLDALRDR